MAPTWKCTICGLVDGSYDPPAHCPECSARREMFEASDEPPHGIGHNPMQPRVGHGGEVVGPGWAGCITDE